MSPREDLRCLPLYFLVDGRGEGAWMEAKTPEALGRLGSGRRSEGIDWSDDGAYEADNLAAKEASDPAH